MPRKGNNSTGEPIKSNSSKLLILLYVVGGIGWPLAFSQETFCYLTPFSQFLAAYIVFRKHTPWNVRTVVAFLSIFILTFFTEAVGVKTGIPFGVYHYGKSLGVHLLNVPLIIGINWVIISYSCFQTSRMITSRRIFQIIISALLMLLLDVLMEPVAAKMDMWYFNGQAPTANYISWFVLGIISSSIWQMISSDNKINRLGLVLIVMQYLFFTSLNITL